MSQAGRQFETFSQHSRFRFFLFHNSFNDRFLNNCRFLFFPFFFFFFFFFFRSIVE